MDSGLRGKRALLMASSRGLGFAVARALAREGANVFITGRNQPHLERAVSEIAALGGGRVWGRCCNLSKPEVSDGLVAEATDRLGGIDIVLANCGGPPMGKALEIEDDMWRLHFDSMVLAPMRVIRLAVPGMTQRGWGRIIAITSSGVPQPIPEMALSNTLRAALTNWLKTLSAELAPHGVTVNTLIPGRVQTDRIAELEAAASVRLAIPQAEVHRQAVAAIPAGRDGDVEEFAGAALFLASRQGGYVTGSAIRVDGGMIRSASV